MTTTKTTTTAKNINQVIREIKEFQEMQEQLKAEIEVKGVLHPVPIAAANGVNPDGSLNLIRNIND